MKYSRGSKGYFYKISVDGTKTRISKEAYLRGIKKNPIIKKNVSPRHNIKTYSNLEEKECRQYLADKIKINMEEFESGKFVSRSQALAISYSQVKKKYPNCTKYFKY